MKGQMFIIAAIFIIIGMVAAKNLLSTTLEEEKRSVEMINADKLLKNIGNEYSYLLSVSASQARPNQSAIAYFSGFSSFLRSDVAGFSVLYAAVYLNESAMKYSVNVGNFLGGLVNITINTTGSSPAGYNLTLSDKENKIVEFSLSSLQNFNVTLNYTINAATSVEKFPILAKNYSLLYIDMKIARSNIELGLKEVYNRTVI